MADKKPKKHLIRQEEIIAYPNQYLFPYVNNDIHEKWNTKWNEKNDKHKEIKTDIRPRKENNRCRKDETIINILRAGHTLLTHGYLMEGIPVPESEMCRSHAMSVKYLLTDCVNLDSLRLRLFDGSNSKTVDFLK